MRKILLFLYTEDGGDQGDRGDHLLPPPHKIVHGGDQEDLLGLLGLLRVSSLNHCLLLVSLVSLVNLIV